jgi:hypothetical protein
LDIRTAVRSAEIANEVDSNAPPMMQNFEMTFTWSMALTITYVTKSRGENRLSDESGGRIASMTVYMALEVVACS